MFARIARPRQPLMVRMIATPHCISRLTEEETMAPQYDDAHWMAAYRQVRAYTEGVCSPLETDDYQLQSIVETSPPKWHIAHTSWFFEHFLLTPYLETYEPFHPLFGYLFNSYYETVGDMHPRPNRGLLSRPTVETVYAYRAHVDAHVLMLLSSLDRPDRDDILFRLQLGLNHEQQHQELLYMDIKHNLSVNPLAPAYRSDAQAEAGVERPTRWIEFDEGLREIGATAGDFHFDNESPRHRVYLEAWSLADRLVTNAEYLDFIHDGGYGDPRLWLADGWQLIRQRGWRHPLYWSDDDGEWQTFTLGGTRPLDPLEPVCHLSYYEADAYARWAGKRLPEEAELECALATQPVEGNFADSDHLHPRAAGAQGQWFGDAWNWTSTAYSAYPGFRPLQGSMGEYNGKFMANQMVLKGGSCVTPPGHSRASYRNFFYPHDRWMFSGLRLADDP
jgi:ergothioneine biosynthesis protein EgtB